MRFPQLLIIVASVVVAARYPDLAQARQAGLPGPLIEIGADAAIRTEPRAGWGAIGPRLAINLTPRTAFELTGDLKTRRHSSSYTGGWSDSQALYGQVRRAIFQRGGYTAAATAGVGVDRDRRYRPEVTYTDGRDRTTHTIPAWFKERVTPAFITGLGFEQRITRYASVRGDLQMTISHSGFLPRVVTGVSVPLGRYPFLKENRTPLKLGGAEVSSGQHVWITTRGGGEVSGSVGAVTASGVDIWSRSGSRLVELAGSADRRAERQPA